MIESVVYLVLDIVMMTLSSVFSALLILYVMRRMEKRIQPFENLIFSFSPDTFSEVAQSLNTLSSSVSFYTEMFTNEETLDTLLQEIASRAVRIFQMSILGTKSGDSRKAAKAEALVNEAVVTGIKKINPVVDWFLRETELDQELEKNPELLGYIIQQVVDKGLLNMFGSELSLPAPAPEDTTRKMEYDFR